MRRKAGSPSLLHLRMCFLVCVMLIIFPSVWTKFDERNGSKVSYTKEAFDSIENSKRSTASPRARNKIDGGRNYTASKSINERNSAALDRFLEDVRKAKSDLKWTDHATRRVDYRARPDDQPVYTNQYSAVSVNTKDVPERADIGYGSGLRGKRSFDRNYETMWMPQKKQHGEESPRDVPQRVYLDNDVTFERDADSADFDALYQFPGIMSDRAVYEGEAMADQPLKERAGKKDLRSSGHWSNSNENPEVTNGESARLRDYEPERSHPSKDRRKLRVDADTQNDQPAASVVSLYDPIRAEVSAPREFPVALENEKSQSIPLYLESLKKTVLELKRSLIPSDKKKDTIPKGEPDWRNGPRSTVEILDFEKVHDKNHPIEEATRRIERAKAIGSEDESDAGIFRGAGFGELYFGGENLKDPRDRRKRTRRSFVASANYTNGRTDASENARYRDARNGDVPGNLTTSVNSEGTDIKSRSNYLNNGSVRISSRMNILRSRGSSLNDNSINVTAAPKTYNGRIISDLKYPHLEACLSNHPVDKSVSPVEINPQANSRERVVTSEIPGAGSESSGQFLTDKLVSKNIRRTIEDRPTLPSVGRNVPVLNATIISIRFSKSNGDADDPRESSARNQSSDESLAARKISRLGADGGGQSKGAEEEFPRGNTSRGFVTNECRVVETTAAATEKENEANGKPRKENREPILGVITVFEPRGRPYQKRETETAARLSRRTEGGEESAGKIRASAVVGESRDANARQDSSTPIDPVTVATAKPEAGNVNTSVTGESITLKNRREGTASIIADDDLRKQQQMVPPSSPGTRNANKSDGNSDIDGIDIRDLGSRGNETTNVKEDTRAVTEAAGYGESGDNLRRKLLWIAATEDPSTDNAKPVPNSSIGIHIETASSENQRKKPTISFKVLRRVKRGDNVEENSVPQSALDSQIPGTNHARYKRSMYPDENLEVSNEVGPRKAADEKEAAGSNDDRQEDDDEDYLNRNVGTSEGLEGDYNNREEDAIEDNDKAIENERAERSSLGRKIDPIKARVDLLIKKKLDRKDEEEYRRKRRSALNMIEYYDYDDEEQERDGVNERQTNNEDDKLSFKDEAKTKREGKTMADLGKKKNEQAEEMMRQEILKKQRKNKEPKEEIVVGVGERKNKTATSGEDDKKPAGSSGSSFEDAGERSIKENSDEIRQSEDSANNAYHVEGLKWLGRSSENKIVSPGNPGSTLKDDYEKKLGSEELLRRASEARVNVNPDVIENILLNIEPFKLAEQNREMEVSENVDFGNKRSDGRYDCRDNDRRSPNNVEPLYEELKNVYDWSDGLKSGPRLRGDQRLRYESDDKLDTNPSQLQPLNDRFLGSDQNARIHRNDASWTTGLNSTPVSNYLALKVTDDMFKGGPEQGGSAGENSPHKFSVGTTVESKTAENENSPEVGAIRQSAIDKDSGSPYETRKYESEMRKVWKRNSNSEKRAAISSQDLHESFVESLDWHDDFDDSVKIRFGRGLKTVDEAISDSSKINDRDDGSTIGNRADINSGFNFPQISHDNSSISRYSYNNTPASSIDIYNVHRDLSSRSAGKVYESNSMNIFDGVEDLEVAEQKYTTRRTPRGKRAAYRALYDNLNPGEGNNLDSRFLLPTVLEDRSDGMYHGYTPNWSYLQDLDRYLTPRSVRSRKKEKLEEDKQKRHFSKKHAKKKSSSRSSSSRNRRHHTHRSDAPRNVNRNDLKPTTRKNKAEASSVTGRTGVQKSKSAERGLLRAEVNETPVEKVLYENVEDRSTAKPEEDDARRKEITLLLAADNVDDESQMDMAVRGELAGKIVEHIFEQVQKHDQLKKVLGPGLQRKENVITAGNIYHQGLDEDGTNRTETMMKRVMELLDRLILNEVQRKSCVFLSPDMREFLGWMLEVDREEESSEEALPLPLVREEIVPEQGTERQFLFDTSEQDGGESVSDLQTKVKVLETLVKEYNALTTKEKTRVQPVHDYLVRQLNLLLQHIEARQSAEAKEKSTSVPTRGAKTAGFFQYQSATPPNTTNASHSIGKDALLSPIDTRNFFQFNNASPNTTDRQLRDSHIASRYRETRSLGKVSSKRRGTKHDRKRHEDRRKIGNHKAPRRKHREHRDRAGESSPLRRRKSRRKRANLEENSLPYVGYEEPAIYDSFELLDTKLTGKSGKRKRELADKKSVATGNDRMLDLLPIKGKNRLEDEVIPLEKREAWKRENEEQLEGVAFGKDMRNSTRRERGRFERLTEGDKREPIDETSSRIKREDIVNGSSAVGSADRFNNSRTAKSETSGSAGNTELKNDNGARNEDRLELLERTINVFGDNRSDAATDTARVDAGEKLAANAGANNEVNGELCAVNRGTKIDNKAYGCTGFVNLTSDTKPRVSEERQKVSAEAGEGADDGAVKLSRATNYRCEKADPEVELKSLRRGRGRVGAADWKMTDTFHGDGNLTRNKLGDKYPTELDEPGDPNTDPGNNSELLRLRSNKWPKDVVEWKLLPVIRTSPCHDGRALSRIHLIGREISPLNVRNVEVQPTAYLNSPRLRRVKRRRRRNDILLPVLRIIGDDFRRGIRPRRVTEIADFQDLHAYPKIPLKARKPLSRLRGNERSDGVAESAAPFALKDREPREISRSPNDPEVDDRAIYGAGSRLPHVWPYYDGFAGSPTLHLAPDILESDGYVYRYPAYLEYGPFKERTRGTKRRRVARRNRFRLGTSGVEAPVDFPGDDSANRSSKYRFARGNFRVETSDEPTVARRGDHLASDETKFARQSWGE